MEGVHYRINLEKDIDNLPPPSIIKPTEIVWIVRCNNHEKKNISSAGSFCGDRADGLRSFGFDNCREAFDVFVL